jgi:PD-(D/E)XK nuclease superfamily
VEDRVIVELKTVVEIAEIHKKQVLTQLKLAGLYTGLIMNFNVEILTDGGVKRVVNPAAGPDCADPDAQVGAVLRRPGRFDGERALRARWLFEPAAPSNLRWLRYAVLRSVASMASLADLPLSPSGFSDVSLPQKLRYP